MNSDLTWQTVSNSLENTLQLAENLGARLRGGEVIELVSDVGGGKTSFVRGLAKGMGSRDKVASPSFTISREYKAADKTLYHFDFYRLDEPGLMINELAEVLNHPSNIIVVEWGKIVSDVLPDSRLTITIQSTDETTREFTFMYPKSLSYLVPENA